MVSISTILIITLILIIFHITLSLRFFATESINALSKKIDLIVEVKEGIDYPKIEPLIEKINSIEGIEKIEFVEKAEALRSFLSRHSNIKAFLTKYKLENPLPSTLEIITEKVENLEDVLAILTQKEYSDIIQQSKIETDLAQKERIENIVNFGKFIENISYWFFVFFILMIVLIIFGTINIMINQKKEEINLMNLIGASKPFIQFPFVFEVIIYSVISIFFAFIINMSIHFQLLNILDSALLDEVILKAIKELFIKLFAEYPSIILFESVVLILCSVIASFIAIEIFLRREQ